MPKRMLVVLVTMVVWLTTAAGASARHEQNDGWVQVPAPGKAEAAVQLKNHINGVLAEKCRTPYTRDLSGTSLTVWQDRHIAAHRIKNLCTSFDVANRGFHSALQLAAHVYGVSYSWLHACDHTEGSDVMKWNGGVVDPGLRFGKYGPSGSSGAYGPMQFLHSTFYNNVVAAFAYARAHGHPVPAKYAVWNSNVGQAFVAAYMFMKGWSGQWMGGGC